MADDDGKVSDKDRLKFDLFKHYSMLGIVVCLFEVTVMNKIPGVDKTKGGYALFFLGFAIVASFLVMESMAMVVRPRFQNNETVRRFRLALFTQSLLRLASVALVIGLVCVVLSLRGADREMAEKARPAAVAASTMAKP